MDDPLRLGFLYPGHAAEDDYPLLAARVAPPVTAEVVHTSVGLDQHSVEALLDLGDHDRLLEGAAALADRGVAVVVWACTSGSFVFGWEGASQQVDRLADRLGVPASSTSFAFVEAARSLGARRVAVAASYPREVAERFVAFLDRAGITVTHLGSAGIVTAQEVGTLTRGAVVALVEGIDRSGAEAVLVPDTAMRTAAHLADLEEAAGRPVLTANQVTMWEALRLAGRRPRGAGLGALFGEDPREGPPPGASMPAR